MAVIVATNLGWTAFLSALRHAEYGVGAIFTVAITQIPLFMDLPIAPIGSISDIRIVILIRVLARVLHFWVYPKCK